MAKQRARVKRDAIERALLVRNAAKADFARRVGIVRTHFHDLLAGRVSPGPGTRSKILKALGGTFDEWFEIVDVAARPVASTNQSQSGVSRRSKRTRRRAPGRAPRK